MRTILITGGAGGIGRATADLFKSVGYNVAVSDIVEPTGPHFFVRADVSDEDQVSDAVEAVAAKYGGIDVLFINHGVGANVDTEDNKIVCQGPLDVDVSNFEHVMDVNLTGAIRFAKYAIPHMAKMDGSAIITSSSIWAYGKLPYAQAYACRKGALTTWTTSLAYHPDVRPIRAVALTLGAIYTPMLWCNPRGAQEAAEQSLLGRAIDPFEVASVALLVANNPAMNACDIMIDGGSFNR